MPTEAEMSYAAELIRDVRTSHDLTLKEVAAVTLYSKSVISSYEHGHLPVPYEYAAQLFRQTKDIRLLQYMCPGLTGEPVEATRRCPRTPPAGDAPHSVKLLLDATEQLVKAMQYTQRILADGIVDDSDNMAIGKLFEHLNSVTKLASQFQRDLMAWHESATQRRRHP